MTDPMAPPPLAAPPPARDPWAGLERTGVWVTRLWGLVVVGVGLWLFASVTLGYDLPAIDWNLAWPLGLMVIGGAVIASAVSRRR